MLAWFIEITKVASCEFVEVFGKDPFFALFFSLFINDLATRLCLLSSAIVFMLTTWPSGSRSHAVVKASQRALIRLECWSEQWYLLLNPSKWKSKK